MVCGDYEHEITEDQVLEYFEVESIDEIDPEKLEEYLREEADDASYDIDDEVIFQLVREQKGLETQLDDIQIELELL
jgi:hypothetical protein